MFPGGNFSIDDVRVEDFHNTIKRIYTKAVSAVLGDNGEMTLRPLAAYYYNDGTPIITVTCIVGPPKKIAQLVKRSRLASWDFAALEWNDAPLTVSIPDLGIRERLAIDRFLPDATAKKIIKKLKLSLAENPADSQEVVESYARFARHTPFFVKIAV